MREKTNEELLAQIDALKEELFNLRFQQAFLVISEYCQPLRKQFIRHGIILVTLHDVGFHPHLESTVFGLHHEHVVYGLHGCFLYIQFFSHAEIASA